MARWGDEGTRKVILESISSTDRRLLSFAKPVRLDVRGILLDPEQDLSLPTLAAVHPLRYCEVVPASGVMVLMDRAGRDAADVQQGVDDAEELAAQKTQKNLGIDASAVTEKGLRALILGTGADTDAADADTDAWATAQKVLVNAQDTNAKVAGVPVDRHDLVRKIRLGL